MTQINEYKKSFSTFQPGKGEAVALYGFSEELNSWVPISSGPSSQDILSRASRLDAFGRQRVSEPYTIFDSKQIVDKGDLFYSEATGSGASSIVYNSGDASTTLSASGSGSYSIRQTKMRFNYQPGKSQQVLATFVLGENTSGTEARVGYFNTETGTPYTGERDGIYFGRDTGYYFAISKTGAENKVYQSNWNIDKFDGDGPSAAELDFTKSQIGAFDFEWLGVGSARCGFVYNGEFYYGHQFNHANNIDGVYMSSPNHSVRYEIFSDGPATEMKQICASIQSEGGLNPVGVSLGISTNSGVAIASNTDEVVLAVRLKESQLYTTVLSEFFSALSTSNANIEWFLCLNPTFSGDALSWQNVSNSALQQATSNGSNIISDRGTVLAAGYTSRESRGNTLPVNTILRLGAELDGTRDIFILGARGVGNAATIYGSLNFLELNLG